MSFEYESLYVTSYANELGKALTSKEADGWEMVGAPVFTKFHEAFGWNPYAVGHQPHFLVLLRRTPAVASHQRSPAGD